MTAAACARWLPVAALLSCLLPGPSLARSPGDAASAAVGDARAWLSRMHAAAATGNYQGTMVFTGGGALSSSRVWHYRVGEQVYERLDRLDGRQQQVVRHNDAVHTLWPQSRLAVQERRETLGAWATTPQHIEPKAIEQYDLHAAGTARIAGRATTVLVLSPRDELRYAQRLWADETTGLMLRADVIGPGADHPVLESTAFSEIEIGVRPQPERVLQVMRQVDGWRIVKPQQRSTTLQAEGWALANPVAGFQLTGCMKRGLADVHGGEPVLQAVFSDGLTHVSVFVEPYDPARHRQPQLSRHGATATLMRRLDEHWITAVGDVPPATLQLFADALQRRP